ncbi:MAG: 2-dehydro-3-deoxygalactonokinase [Balneolaceae bacterium]
MTDKLHTDNLFLSCDWGTTSLRLQLVDFKSGEVLAGISDDDGIKKTYSQWKSYSGTQNRVAFYLSVLDQKISFLSKKVQQNLNHVSVVVSGMASASIGLKELPYQTLPVSLDDPDLYVESFKPTDQLTPNLYLVSGIRTSGDVIRGEETQLLGLSEKTNLQNGVYIMPGTHSKHVFIKDRTITDFKTYLTGELFEVLATQSTLSDSVSEPENPEVSEAFKAGCEASRRENLLHSLFTIRSRDLLQKTPGDENYDYLSGLLIGSELSAFANQPPEQVVIAGENPLLNYYSEACRVLKINYTEAKMTAEITAAAHRKILINLQNQNITDD